MMHIDAKKKVFILQEFWTDAQKIDDCYKPSYIFK